MVAESGRGGRAAARGTPSSNRWRPLRGRLRGLLGRSRGLAGADLGAKAARDAAYAGRRRTVVGSACSGSSRAEVRRQNPHAPGFLGWASVLSPDLDLTSREAVHTTGQ